MTLEEQEILIGELENDIDRLHALYNQYFMGIEKLEPTVVRKNLDRKINLLRREHIKNTALRFRMQMQIQKYNTQSTYWNRVCRQIENGTYNRQVMLAKKRIHARHKDPIQTPPVSETDILFSQTSLDADDAGRIELDMNAFGADLSTFGIDLDDPFADTILASEPSVPKPPPIEAPQKPPGPAVSAPRPSSRPPLPKPSRLPAPPRKSPPPLPTASNAKPRTARQPEKQASSAMSVSQEQAQSLYRRYLAARKRCNEPVDNVSFRSVSDSLNAKLKASGGKVDFKVVIRGGKAVIKAVKGDNDQC